MRLFYLEDGEICGVVVASDEIVAQFVLVL